MQLKGIYKQKGNDRWYIRGVLDGKQRCFATHTSDLSEAINKFIEVFGYSPVVQDKKDDAPPYKIRGLVKQRGIYMACYLKDGVYHRKSLGTKIWSEAFPKFEKFLEDLNKKGTNQP